MASRGIRLAKNAQLIALNAAISLVRSARDLAVLAGCPRSAEAIRRTLKSLDGAKRHMQHRLQRSK